MFGFEVIILAGGLGTRLRELVNDRPKPMAQVQGEPFLAHLMRYHVRRGAQHLIISVGYMSSHIMNFFGDEFEGVPISYAVEDVPLGTGGAVKKSASWLKTKYPCLLVNGDSFFPFNLRQLIELHNKKRANLTMALFNATEDHRYGAVNFDKSGRVTEFDNKNALEGQPANGGVYVLETKRLSWLEEQDEPFSFEEIAIPKLIGSGGRVFAMTQSAHFIDIGMPADYKLAQKTLFS